jgi:hypothetical protein
MAAKPEQWDLKGQVALVTGGRAGSATKPLGPCCPLPQ